MSLPLAAARRDPEPAGRGGPVRTLGVVSASVLAFPLVVAPAQAATIPFPKPSRTLPRDLDVVTPYQKGTLCLTKTQPGVTEFARLLNATYGTHVYGTLRTCAAEHGEGRALDWMLDAKDPEQLALGTALTRWLAAPDSEGRPGAMARRFGINYMIWNRQQWNAWSPDMAWKAYYGVSPHTDHIHFSFTWDGATERTSWWSGKAVTQWSTNQSTAAPVATTVSAESLEAFATRTLRRGSSGTAVTLVQTALKITPDGSFGPATEAAVTAYQKSKGLTSDGVVSKEEWKALIADVVRAAVQKYASAGTTLRRGSSGQSVRTLQRAIGGLTVDGAFGPKTETAVKAYEKSKRLTVDGVADKAVWNALLGVATATPPPPPTATTGPLARYATTTLKLWSRGEAVKALQKAIGKLTVDGSYGRLTEARVKEYQKSKGLAVTGVTDAKVWKALMGGTTTTPTTPPPTTTTNPLSKYASVTLTLWSRGEAVKALQKAVGRLTVDGSYGRLTEARVKEYQKSKSLAVTGVTDATVWRALMGATSTGTPTTPTAPTASSTSTEFTALKSTTLRAGSSGAAVKALQRGLGGLVVDGAFGSRTLAGVTAFQTSAKLSVTGVVDRATWDALERKVHPLHPYWATVLKRGSKGTAVVALQKALRITADGSFGPQTESSVRAAQKAAKLAQTGVVATVTWKAVEARMPR